MGMSASQARFLSLTARLSDIEGTQQNLAYAKQRLSENTSYINDQYLEALNKTKYQVITGYNSTEACYADVSYNQLTGCNSVANGKQYLVKDNTGKVLVTEQLKAAFESGNGDYNKFLMALGYTQADINVNDYKTSTEKIHQAWDKYLVSIGKSIDNKDGQHILEFDYISTNNNVLDGYPTYQTAHYVKDNKDIPVYKDNKGYFIDNFQIYAIDSEDGVQCGFYDTNDEFYPIEGVSYNTETGKFIYDNENFKDENGNPLEFDYLYFRLADDKTAIVSEDPYSRLKLNAEGKYQVYMNEDETTNETCDLVLESTPLNFEGTSLAQRELYDYALSLTEAYYNDNSRNSEGTNPVNLKYDANQVNYYKNIFNEMRSNGYTTVKESFNSNEENAKLKDPEWFVRQLKAGKLTLSYYSTVEKSFIGTSLDDDESIAEKEDTSAVKIAEQVYKSAMDNLESQDKQFDLRLNRLETEHNAIQTELEAVQKVLKNNVESSFKTFNG